MTYKIVVYKGKKKVREVKKNSHIEANKLRERWEREYKSPHYVEVHKVV